MSIAQHFGNETRVTIRRAGEPDAQGKCIVYWMQRAQRAVDNPALDKAIEIANALRLPVVVLFGLHPRYPNANERHYQFLVEGLQETRERCAARNVAFVLRSYPHHDLIKFCEEVKPALVIGDENPMREPESWRRSAAEKLRVPFWTIDADVIVPVKLFEKEEYAARTLRPKIHRMWDEYMKPLANPVAEVRWPDRKAQPPIDVTATLAALPLNRSAAPVKSFRGGTAAGLQTLQTFVDERLARYDTARNLPHQRGTSDLSPYLHFGHVGPHTIALAVRESNAPQPAKDAFIEEMIVRRELAINYVARNAQYDTLAGCHGWARQTLDEHRADPREYLYSLKQFEQAETHDPLWNAAQLEMVKRGKMHGYLRMYWAKKILEWTPAPEDAFAIAVELNDRYELDGRDPNGYTGIAWAMGAKHDRPWAPARKVFGMIRFMAASGCARKFDVNAYISMVNQLPD